MYKYNNEGSEQHLRAAEYFKLAAKHHIEAAKNYEEGNYEKAAHHALSARGYHISAEIAANNAAEYHSNHHGIKL